MHISSVEDGGERYPPPRKPRFERWKERVEAAGFSIHWRPTGDASTLYLPGHEGDFAEKKQWIGAAKVEAERIEQGLDPRPIEDRSFPSSHLRAEARALAPWLTGGEYEKNPIPLAFVYPRAPRGKELGGTLGPAALHSTQGTGDHPTPVATPTEYRPGRPSRAHRPWQHGT